MQCNSNSQRFDYWFSNIRVSLWSLSLSLSRRSWLCVTWWWWALSTTSSTTNHQKNATTVSTFLPLLLLLLLFVVVVVLVVGTWVSRAEATTEMRLNASLIHRPTLYTHTHTKGLKESHTAKGWPGMAFPSLLCVLLATATAEEEGKGGGGRRRRKPSERRARPHALRAYPFVTPRLPVFQWDQDFTTATTTTTTTTTRFQTIHFCPHLLLRRRRRRRRRRRCCCWLCSAFMSSDE